MRKLLTLPLIGVGLLMGACASEGPLPVANDDAQCDAGKVATVNDWASRRGYKVVWFGCPKARDTAVAKTPA